MARQLPDSFTAGRRITLEGVTYTRGQTIPDAVVARTKKVNAYLSRRWIVPHPDPEGRRTSPDTPTPTQLDARDLRALLAR